MTSSRPSDDSGIERPQLRDLERYLDATRSELLFARKVMLVEGPAEAFLIPVLSEAVLGIDLDRHGIVVVPIFGTHFGSYTVLFGADQIRRRCAIVADGDLRPSDAEDLDDAEPDDQFRSEDLVTLESEFVKVFTNQTTFERAITLEENIQMLADAAEILGATRSAAALRSGLAELRSDGTDEEAKRTIRRQLRQRVLNVAKGKGKARFAQTASAQVTAECRVPQYIRDAIEWLLAETPQ